MDGNIKSETEESVKRTTRSLSEKDKKDLVIQEAISKYKFLDSEHESYNENLVKKINYLSAGYESEGQTPSVALKTAIEELVPKIEKKEQVKPTKKAEVMQKQPPKAESSKKVKQKSFDDYDWEEMSQADFRKLYKESPDLVNKYLRRTNIE